MAPQPLHELVVLFLPDAHERLWSERRGVLQCQHTSGGVAAELCPEVADIVRLAGCHPLERPGMEIALSLFLPAGLQRLHPALVGGGVVASIDCRRCPLEHVEVLGVLAKERDDLNAAGARADDRNPLVRELVEPAARISPGVFIVPTRRVKAVPLEILDARDAGKLGTVKPTRRHHNEARPDVVAAVGSDSPTLDVLVPAQPAHLRAEYRAVIEPIVLADAPAVFEDLGTVGELLRGDEVQLFEQRDIAIGFVVALDAGIPIPVPNAAEVPALLDDPDVVDASLLELGGRQQAREAPAEDGDIDILRNRLARHDRSVRVDVVVLLELVLQFDVLLRAFRAQPLLTLMPIPLSQRVDVDVGGRLRRSACVKQRHRVQSSRGSPVPMYFDSW